MWLDRLAEMKKASKKTLRQIADESGVPIGTLNKLFAGQTKDPKLDTVRSVVHALGYTLDDLEPRETAKNSPSADESAPEEEQLINLYRKLNQEGQEKLVDYADDLVSSGKYIKSDSDRLGNKKRA